LTVLGDSVGAMWWSHVYKSYKSLYDTGVKTREEVSPEKARGGFYTPPGLVSVCLDRVEALTRGRSRLSLLEPSAGDGAFIRRMAGRSIGRQVTSVFAGELVRS